ncbi:MAG: hypothetical protein ACK6DR_07880 [Gemmatimonas sp.]|uniref:hypothetical protein n=1 Tax=Gemmatimonas sp. TaxID=1962908 RepID=UPI00391ADB9A
MHWPVRGASRAWGPCPTHSSASRSPGAWWAGWAADALLRLEAERAEVQARLGAAIAALENIRLDLLRLEANRTLPGQLTQELEVVHELQRHVDAMQEVNRALRPRWPEPTPV